MPTLSTVQKQSSQNSKPPMGETQKNPLKRVHINFKGHMWLILLDALTKWPRSSNVNYIYVASERTIEVLFARYGIPHILVLDNGTRFTSAMFIQFCKNYEIRHKLSAPCHSSTNGEAERFVQTFKAAMHVIVICLVK